MTEFVIFPAIDLRGGQVVRLQTGDPAKQTTYSLHPEEVAEKWLEAGAVWLHVVNLDGAFDQPDSANQRALQKIITRANAVGARVQFGGGLRTREAVERALQSGVQRAVVGSMAVEHPQTISNLVNSWGADRLAASLDAKNGIVQVHGWKGTSGLNATEAARSLAESGLCWLVFTDIERDGLLGGLNVEATCQVAQASRLKVIASGGVAGVEDILQARKAGLAGVIIGKALYEGKIKLETLLKEIC